MLFLLELVHQFQFFTLFANRFSVGVFMASLSVCNTQSDHSLFLIQVINKRKV